MLIISRKKDEKIIVADEIEITILEVGRNRVRFGIKAPKNVTIQTRLKDVPAPENAEGTDTVKHPGRVLPMPVLPPAANGSKPR
jgi:carbon storage regulator